MENKNDLSPFSPVQFSKSRFPAFFCCLSLIKIEKRRKDEKMMAAAYWDRTKHLRDFRDFNAVFRAEISTPSPEQRTSRWNK
jgi:hypothetical protein